MRITALDSIYNNYNVALLFAIYKLLYDSRTWHFNKINDEIKAPWQRVMHAYHKRWHIFMALYFEMHWLPWFTVKWKKTLANPELI